MREDELTAQLLAEHYQKGKEETLKEFSERLKEKFNITKKDYDGNDILNWIDEIKKELENGNI